MLLKLNLMNINAKLEQQKIGKSSLVNLMKS